MEPPFDVQVAPGFMAAGDAAAHVDPTTAEGHGPALTAGYYVGLVGAKAIQKKDLSLDSLWEYNVHIMKHFGAKHALSLVLQFFLEDIKIEGLEFILKRRLITNQDLKQAYLDPNYTLRNSLITGKKYGNIILITPILMTSFTNGNGKETS